MIVLPSPLKRYQKQARDGLAHGLAREIEFSGPTYQVLVIDPHTHKEEWAFLQLDALGRLKDSFCSCEQSGTTGGCIHQAIAFLHVYGSHPLPLHQRFDSSLWNKLCRWCSDAMEGKPDQLKATKEGRFVCRGAGNKVIFSLKSHTPDVQKKIEQMVFHRREETEETSLKFSNLSENEIAEWQRGKPTPQLSYELSFWSDLAKWLFAMQEEGQNCEIAFASGAKKLPASLTASFPSLTAEWALSEESLTAIIPSLTTVSSPLAVRTESTEGIDKITYDKEHLCFHIHFKKEKGDFQANLDHPKGIELDGWTFVPGDGFYSKEMCFSRTSEDMYDVEKLLNDHAHLLKQFISGCVIREVPVSVSYSLSFDKDSNLHIQSYLFHPGDLASPSSHAFGAWVYVDGRGFYRWEGRYFDEIETVVPAADVPDFISRHRTWLNAQEGFHTHLNPLSADLNYAISDDNYLVFSRNLAYHEGHQTTRDFDRWVYIEGQGFFSKAAAQVKLPVRAGTMIPPDQIGFFIRSNRDELKLVKHFFSSNSPVAKSHLKIELMGDDKICVSPDYELLPAYAKRPVRFFDDYSYVPGEGFHELLGDARLPEKYRQTVIIEGEDVATFIQSDMDGLLSFISHIDPRLRRPKNVAMVAEKAAVEEREGSKGYALQLDFESDLGKLSLASLWKAFQKNQRFLFTEEGLFDLADRRYGWIKHIAKKKIDKKGNTLFLTPLELLRLNAFEQIHVPTGTDPVRIETKKLIRELTEFKVPENPDIRGLKSTLRPYQEIGVNWLWFLYHHGLSGLLCDDMGLGKTHQAMALLSAIKNKRAVEGKGIKAHFVVVCPTSVIYHWQDKLKEYLPDMKVWTFHGANRAIEGFEQDYDVLLTSYGVWRNEVEQLKKIPFEAAIFDELQIAKNQTSRIYAALLKVNARMRLGMTGTPIENRLRELKTLFDIVLPTYMPSEHDYREHFIRPIEKESDPERQRLLARLIKPFVLRRKKEDVLLDLPEKTEQIAHCELLPDQKKLYADVLTSSRDRLIEQLQDGDTPVPYVHIFALLSHLKQICNHPAAYLKKPAEYKHYQSGKWDLFTELLEEARESRQKVVVFSHYLSMLDIIEDYLKEHGIGFSAIRGVTVNRGEQVHKFHNDPQCEVFVASLQAAGLGIDLTPASVVVHYDRWWNAARENQATDRVHRIGQTRGVQVFKLMTKGTLEEHIDFLINKKGRLMEEVVGADDHETLKKFDRQEMINLLQTLPI